uniref:Uncharacterized protein n=1 Tax=Populus trichocarpa TaxID=3694 RepID=A0A3N7EQP5_POPTR
METGIDKLIQSVKEELEISYAFSDTCCIYKVPERLRELNEKAYTPRVVSVGPIHHGKDMLKAMEDHKRMYLQEFIARTKRLSRHSMNVAGTSRVQMDSGDHVSLDIAKLAECGRKVENLAFFFRSVFHLQSSKTTT